MITFVKTIVTRLMPLIPISNLEDESLKAYARLTEAQLRNRLEPELGLFIAESPKVIRLALKAGNHPVSFLMEQKHIQGDARDILEKYPDVPVYTAERQLLEKLTGYKLTRGVLSAMRRPEQPDVEALVKDATRLAVIQGVTDTTNIGAIFRSAAALRMDAVLLTRDSCDPLNRRSVRVSMGTIFQVPWGWIDDPIRDLKAWGFKTVALALSNDSVSIEDSVLMEEPRLALILGTEGDGLPQKTILQADYVARIPMRAGVDSLNVAAASAVAFWQLRKRT